MTVQQERPATAAKPTTAPAVRLPAQRAASDDAPAPEPPVVRQPGAWASEEDRIMVRWLGVMMVTLSLYCTVFLWIAARVWT